MLRYSIGGRATATAATIDNAAFGIWNPSTTKSIFVREIHFFNVSAVNWFPGLERITVKGTTATDVAADIDTHYDHAVTPPSAAVLMVDWSAEPTLAPPHLMRGVLPAAIGAGFIWVFAEPIQVLSVDGLVVVTTTAVATPLLDVAIIWDE
jgi:hypothetical protein